jgi:glucose/mannose-6-phosphate isomerase
LRKTILDDPCEIRKVDKNGMLSFCVEAAKHYDNAAKLANRVKVDYPEPEAIIVAGMGGSAIGGELLKDWSRDSARTPIEVCREYHLPAYANRKTLVLVTSYSGETEETLSVFLEALKRKCMILAISSGGTLQNFAQELSVPHLLVPGGMAPRASLPYLFIPLPIILRKIGNVSNVDRDIVEAVNVLKQVAAENSPEILSDHNPAKILADGILGTVPAVYGFQFYRAVAQRFKTQINENSKNPAKWEIFPELDHNEIVGWENAREFAEHFSVIFIRDCEESMEIRRRIEVSRQIINHVLTKLFEVWSRGKTKLAKMSSVICTGDFTSVYLAVLRGVDPTPVKSIDVLKRRLKDTGNKEKTVNELQKLAKN